MKQPGKVISKFGTGTYSHEPALADVASPSVSRHCIAISAGGPDVPSEDSMIIRIDPVSPADVDALAALARVVWQQAYADMISQAQIDYMLAQRYNAARLLAELETAGIWWDKAVCDGQLAAFASTQLTGTPGEMKLDKLYVDPRQQRLGLGGQLIERAEQRARAQGLQTLILAVNKNNTRALNAYRKHGFSEREAVCVDIGNGFVMDDFIMAKSLH
jgi:ribosomal protein S18 acetylase RimI-like enzyme